jgi:cytosine/adenosine deaminase-related metal-dependent hydrolase
MRLRTTGAAVFSLGLASSLVAQATWAPAPSPGVRYNRLLIRNAMVVDGAGNPARGPMDIVIQGSTIISVQPTRPINEFGTPPRDTSLLTRADTGHVRAPTAGGQADASRYDRVIDATGMYVTPGIIDLHGHIHFSRNNIPWPKDYEYKLWLGHGITTIREPGSGEGTDTTVAHAKLSAENRIAAPTIIPYVMVEADTPDSARARVRIAKLKGARGLKVFINRPDVWAAIADEAKKQDLPIATDLKIQETDAVRAAQLGIRSLEHWYGVPDAAIPGPQRFPDYYSYDNESDRFRWAGDLWRQADSARLSAVLDTMLAHNVTWDPTFAVYEANRDLSRARTLPWFREYAMPQLMAYFEPDPQRHGSYHYDWTTADEVMWRDNMRIWMKWVREYAARGGNVTIGSDAGFIYHLYGFGTIREMELHQEAGFHPIEVIQQATSNGAKALGLTNTGVVRPGFVADLAIVDGNPLHNLKVFYGTGVDVERNGKIEHRGGVRYTIKQGIVFDAPQLLADVRRMVEEAKRTNPQTKAAP